MPRKIKLGAKVKTNKGDRIKGSRWTGTVVGFTMFRDYEAVLVKKNRGRVVRCLKKNLEVVG